MRGILGIIVLIGITYLLSNNKKKISWGQVLWGLSLQGLLALTILKSDIWGMIGLLLLIYFVFSYNIWQIRGQKPYTKKSIFKEALLLIIFIGISIILGLIEQKTKIITLIYKAFISFLIIYYLLKSIKIPYIKNKKWANSLGIIFILLSSGIIIGQGVTGSDLIQSISNSITEFLHSHKSGGYFVFGNLMDDGFVFALYIISSTVFFASVMSILDYLGITSNVVNSMACFISWNMKLFGIKPISGLEALISTANIFLSMQASPLLVRQYLPNITLSEVSTIIVTGLATIAGGTMAIFINAGIPAEYLLSASVMSVPAAICLSKILCPETETPETLNRNMTSTMDIKSSSLLGAASDGIVVGMRSGVLITAMIMGFISLIALANKGFGFLDFYIDGQFIPFILGREAITNGKSFIGIIPSSIDQLFSYIGTPLAWLLGTPMKDIFYVGELLGLKVAINEAVAYTKMLEYIKLDLLSKQSIIIASYALCGFANIGSLGILIGIISSVVPERKDDFIKLGIKGMIVAAFASFMTAAFVSISFI